MRGEAKIKTANSTVTCLCSERQRRRPLSGGTALELHRFSQFPVLWQLRFTTLILNSLLNWILFYSLNCTGIALELHWNCTGIALELHWNCTGTALVQSIPRVMAIEVHYFDFE